MFIYAIIRTTDEIEVYESETAPTYDTLSNAVGGWIEGVPLEGVWAYCNEEGKLNGLPTNKIATAISHRDKAIYPTDWICGDMIVTGPIDEEGDETSLDLQWIEGVRQHLGMTA